MIWTQGRKETMRNFTIIEWLDNFSITVKKPSAYTVMFVFSDKRKPLQVIFTCCKELDNNEQQRHQNTPHLV